VGGAVGRGVLAVVGGGAVVAGGTVVVVGARVPEVGALRCSKAASPAAVPQAVNERRRSAAIAKRPRR
jgi:hypothetical protein